MADNGRTSLSLHHRIRGRSFPGWINLSFISLRIYLLQEQIVQHISPHIVLEFLVPVILDFLKLKCQGNGVSPFETHSKTIWVAITSLLLYCLAYDSEVRLSHARPAYAHVVHRGMVLFGWLSSVSLASILFLDSVRPALYFLYILFLAYEWRCWMLWNWLRERMMGNVPQEVNMQERQMRRALINWGWFMEHTSRNREGLLPV